MATSTFSKQFFVTSEKASEFVKEITKTVAPTLQKDFQARLVHLSQEEELKNNLVKALNK